MEEEKTLIDDLLILMEKHRADYTNTFRLLTLDRYKELPFYDTLEWANWFQKWTRQLGTRQMNISKRIDQMEHSNPVVIPRNLIVEEALISASKENNYDTFNQLIDVLKDPYNYKREINNKFTHPKNSNDDFITYCGT